MDFKPIDKPARKLCRIQDIKRSRRYLDHLDSPEYHQLPTFNLQRPSMTLRIALPVARRALPSTLSLRSTFFASVRKPTVQTPSRSLSSTAVRYSTPMAAQTDTAAAETAASSGITPDSLSEKLKSTIGATYVSIEDMSGGCGQAFNAIIVSPEFEKKTLLARHRLVNNALKSEIAAIHAWTPKCLTPEQWDKEKEKMS